MSNRTDKIRNLAGGCLELSQSTSNPDVRMSLLLMAQKLHQLATAGGAGVSRADLERIGLPDPQTRLRPSAR